MFPYENLEVYKKAFDLNRHVYRIIKEKQHLPSYLKSQLGRASLSIVLNIAEGSGKFTDRDRKNFLSIARGSVFECAAILQFLNKEEEVTGEIHLNLADGYDEVSRMLYAMIKRLEK